SLCSRRVLVDILRQQRRHRGRQSFHQSDLDEDQWFAWKRRMEKGEAATVGREAASQIGPSLDLVYCLIGDQLLQHRRRRLPIDPPQFEEAAVEPRREQMLEIGIEQLQ